MPFPEPGLWRKGGRLGKAGLEKCWLGRSASNPWRGELSRGLKSMVGLPFVRSPGDSTKARLEPERLGARTVIRRKLL